LSVLDLCCGKGGDLTQKWKKARIAHYVGSDLSLESVKEAKRRHEEHILNSADVQCLDRRSVQRTSFPAIFIVADAGDDENLLDDILRKDVSLANIRHKIMFDIVSVQFAVHYMFESERKLRGFFRNVTDRLEEGGHFIGTTIDSDRLVYKIREAGADKKLTIGNDYYSIVFGQDTFKKKDTAYGIKYYFYLRDAIGKSAFSDDKPKYVPEFLVAFDTFTSVALDYGLVLEKKENFHEYHEQKQHQNGYYR
jgi:mRNA (guanine-N7-)-methyltransferase